MLRGARAGRSAPRACCGEPALSGHAPFPTQRLETLPEAVGAYPEASGTCPDASGRRPEAVGAVPDAVRAYDAGLFADSTTRLVWEPTDAGAFADGRHGFTTGRSALLSAAGDTLYAGVYLTMWRVEAGRWRVILDTGADAE